MLFRPNSHPLNWYPSEVTGSVELLAVYVADIEGQVCKGITDYQLRAAKVFVEPRFDEEPGRVVTVHKDLDDDTWDLTTIFEEYFPSLQRRSALVTLFSFFEHELDALCKRIKSQDGCELSLADIAGKGIFRSTTYLTKVAGVTDTRNSPEWHEVKNIQLVRNLIVHADGKLPPPPDARSASTAAYIEKSPHLRGTSEVELMAGYLDHVLRTCDAYFRVLHAGIEHKYGVA
jgi:hypothetical protein